MRRTLVRHEGLLHPRRGRAHATGNFEFYLDGIGQEIELAKVLKLPQNGDLLNAVDGVVRHVERKEVR